MTTAPDSTFVPAPIPDAQLNSVVLPFGQSTMLPPAAYTSPDVLAWEKKNFFSGWTCVGRSSDVAAPGAQRAERVGEGTVLLVRGEDGVLRAFANVCRHRGHEILPCGGSTTKKAIVCPYHAWGYRLDGELFSAAGYKEMPTFDMGDFPLKSMAVAEMHGFIYVDPSGTAGPLDVHFDGIEERFLGYDLADLVVADSHSYVVNANWKVIIENYQECYHCTSIHPELTAVCPPESGENWASSGAWVGGWQDLRPHAITMSLDGQSHSPFFPGLSDLQKRRIDYIGLFPNLLVSLHPDYVMTHRMVPLTTGTTHVECSWMFRPEDIAREGFSPKYAVDFWDITNREDWGACESVQRGMESGNASAGPLSPDEDAIYQFVTMIARGYRGQPLAAKPAEIPARPAVSV